MCVSCFNSAYTLSVIDYNKYTCIYVYVQGGSKMTGTNCDLFTHKSSRSYLNHLVYGYCNFYMYIATVTFIRRDAYVMLFSVVVYSHIDFFLMMTQYEPKHVEDTVV
jgi:hypothetical protein